MIDKKSLGNRIRIVRKNRGMTTDDMSNMIGINATFLRQIECGQGMPSLPAFVSICEVLRVSSDYLLNGNLSNNELAECRDLNALWESAKPSDIELLSAMLQTALRHLGIDSTSE